MLLAGRLSIFKTISRDKETVQHRHMTTDKIMDLKQKVNTATCWGHSRTAKRISIK